MPPMFCAFMPQPLICHSTHLEARLHNGYIENWWNR
jgi:hypothetical protein